MAERATVSQGVQIGVETTPGTGVPSDKRLSALGFSPNPQANFTPFAPMGSKYDTIEALIQEWTTSPLQGYPTYTEIVYPLCGILTNVVPSTVNVAVKRWTFNPSTFAEDTVATFTVERGGAVQAERVVNGIISALNLNFARGASGMGGTMLARALETGITMTASPTGVALKPILPGHVSAFLDATSGALGTTKLTRLRHINWLLENRFGPLWVLDDALDSFVTHVELKPNNRFDISVEANTAGMAILANARNTTKKFLKLKATSKEMIPLSVPATPYSLTINACVEVGGIGGLQDDDGVYAGQYTLSIVHDDTWGKAYEVIVDNDIAGL